MDNMSNEKLIAKAHDKITRTKGREYSPTALEIENEINKQLTAVDWLVQRVNSDCLNSTFIRPELIEEATIMFHNQMIDFHKWMIENDTEKNSEMYFGYSYIDMLNKYYNETYDRAADTE